jgi:hypothetical protein
MIYVGKFIIKETSNGIGQACNTLKKIGLAESSTTGEA